METITLNMTPSASLTTCHASQYDIGRQVRFNLVNGADNFVLSGGETVTLKIRRADGVFVENQVPNTSSNYVIWTSVAGECDAAGISECELSVTEGGDLLGSANFWMEVEADAYDGADIRTLSVGPADICTFETTLPEPLQSVLVNVVATQPSGTPTPSTPLPITGYSSANIVNTQNESIVDLFSIDSGFRGVVAFNQFLDVYSFSDNIQWESESIQSNGDNKYTITFSGNETSRFWFKIINNKDFDIVDGHKYLFITNFKMSNGSFSNAGTSIRFSYGNTTVETIQTGTPGIGDYILAATTTGTVDRIQIYNTGDSSITSSTIMTIQPILFDLTQMFGSTIADYIYTLESGAPGAGVAFFRNIYPDDYYAYDSGTTEIVGKETPEATIAFGQTVYGGVLDVTRGIFRVTHEIVDMGDLSWSTNTYQGVVMMISYFTTHRHEPDEVNCKCDIYEVSNDIWSSGTLRDKIFCNNYAGSSIYVYDSSYTDANTFKTAVTGHKICYELATPFDIDLTPEVISAIVGENNVFADCGDIALEYLDLL